MQGGGGQSLIAYLKDRKERKETTDQVISRWKKSFANVTSCNVEISSYSSSSVSMFVMPGGDKLDIYIQSDDF